jgi:hypothetical protein
VQRPGAGERRGRDRFWIGAQRGLDQRVIEPFGIDYRFDRLRELGFGPDRRRNLGLLRSCYLRISARRRLRCFKLRVAPTGRRDVGIIERFHQTGRVYLRIVDSFRILERQRQR